MLATKKVVTWGLSGMGAWLLALACAMSSAGCNNFRGSILPHSDCANDLIDQGYLRLTRHPDRSAEEICEAYTPEQIATAKTLMQGGYEDAFGVALKDAKEIPKPQLECAMKERAGVRHSRIYVSDACRRSVATR